MKIWLLSLILLVNCLLPYQDQAGRYVDRPDPFGIEIPGLKTGIHRARDGVDLSIPDEFSLTSFRLWLLEPYDGRIDYGGFTARLNGQSLATVGEKGSRIFGKFLDVDLTQSRHLAMKPGKNVIEVTARDSESNIIYRAAFVLLSGYRRDDSPPPAGAEIVCQSKAATLDPNVPISNQNSIRLMIDQPSGPIDRRTDGPLKIRVSGEAVDLRRERLTITVNATRIETTRKGDSLSFDHEFDLAPSAMGLLVEARDRHGNLAICTIPVTGRTLAAVTGGRGRLYALVVGVSAYGSTDRGLGSLKYAHQDARLIDDWLRNAMATGFQSNEIVLLVNEQATLAAVRSAINRFLTKAGEDDLIFLFLAGHGGIDRYDPEQYYFLLHDSKLASLKETAYPMAEIGDFLQQYSQRTRLISFLDTCHSGQTLSRLVTVGSKKSRVSSSARRGVAGRPSIGQSVVSGTGRDDQFNFHGPSIFAQKGWTTITSAAANEDALESEGWGGGHGVFTWSLMNGLKKGMADLDGDCRITARELGDYLRRVVPQLTDGSQHPQFRGGGAADLLITTFPRCRP
jgi:uncharacterized caspase-like protein